jgi:uncharacterized protein YukJ
MPLKTYGVWVGYPRTYNAEKNGNTPHLQLRFDDNQNSQNGEFRAAINIKSSTNESRLVYWFVRDFKNHPITEDLASLEPGWHGLSNGGPPALDYIRGNLISLKDGTILDHNLPGENNDIIDFISPVLTEAIHRKATIHLFGEQFPGGIHDVHMNQGNEGRFAESNGVWQDGGILLHFPDDGHWEGIFLAFAVQKVHTDNDSGDPIGDVSFVELIPTPLSTIVDDMVIIRAALVNPIGPDGDPSGQSEAVFLVNNTLSDIQLDGWTIQNRNRDSQALSGVLPTHSSRTFQVPDCPLTNKGGTITLLNAAGLKVDGVSYTKAQARREGNLVYFH